MAAQDDGPVVPLRAYLEQKIEASHSELRAEIGTVRAEMAAGQQQSSSEHAEVRADLSALQQSVALLVAQDNREKGARSVKQTVWRATAAIIAAMASISGAAAALAGLFG